MTTSSVSTRRTNPWTWVLAGGIVGGTLDIAYACLFWAVKAGVPATRIFQSIAAGLLGNASFKGGAATAALGLVLHYFIALSMAAAYCWPQGRGRKIRSGSHSASRCTCF